MMTWSSFAGAFMLVASVVWTGCAKSNDSPPATDTPAVAAPADTQPSMPTQQDAEMQAVLDAHAALGPKPLETLTAAEARKQPSPADAVMALLKKQGKSTAPEAVGKVVNRTIPGPGGAIPVRIYWPKGDGPFPVIVYYHGGGWVIANLDTYDASARALTNAANAIVISSHYRQGPEHKFPAAHDDAWAAWQWSVKNAASLKGDTARIAVAGESAGGNLAAFVTLMARDQKTKLPVHQLLVYPIANYDLDSPSYRENADARPLSKAGMQWFFRNYLKSEADGADWRISLLSVKDVKGLPPTTVILAQIDPLRSEGQAYAEKLTAAGVDVQVKRFDGVTHEFFGMSAVHPKAKQAVADAASRLRASFGN
jgi:acetyl esterase